jgi:hypothetical protein
MTETEMMILGVVALIAIYFLFIKKKDKDDDSGLFVALLLGLLGYALVKS